MLFVNKYTYKVTPKYSPLNENIVFEKKITIISII